MQAVRQIRAGHTAQLKAATSIRGKAQCGGHKAREWSKAGGSMGRAAESQSGNAMGTNGGR